MRLEARPHVVAWNLTRRCNLACAHCYISAGSWHAADGELSTDECRRVADEILEVQPGAMLILSGGEPLLRDDLEAIARHATERGATVVVGTNGTRLTDDRIESLRAAGVRGVALSIDSLDPRYHDRFRHGAGSLEETLAAVERLERRGLPFLVQTTVTHGNRDEIETLAEWAAERGAMAFNCYFVVATGRGAGLRPLLPAENEAVLRRLIALELRFRGRMLVRSKCQPQIMRLVHQAGVDSSLARYATRCPCGVQYCRITPEGKVTPCPYLPVVAGDLRRQTFGEVWREGRVFVALREGSPGGKCGRCEYRAVCGGCRARAYADHGDPLAADDACAYEPDGERALVAAHDGPTYGEFVPASLEWSPEAEARMARIPSFVRGVVTSRAEAFAARLGHATITPEILDEMRAAMPIDFSKARAFFEGGGS